MPSVKLNLSPLGKVKLALHAAQALMITIALIVFIAMGTRQGDSGGAGIYYLVLTLLSIPALIYLAGTPMWTRTQRFANRFAFLAIDAVFAILWLAAWAAMVAWVRRGIRAGAEKEKKDSGQADCSVFDPATFGTPAKCKLGNACVGVGVTLFISFIPTAVISLLFIRKVRNDPQVPHPWLGKQVSKGGEYVPAEDNEAGHDGAWSTEMQDDTGYGGAGGAYDTPHSPSAYDVYHQRPAGGASHDDERDDDEHRLLQGAGAQGHGPAGHEYGPAAGEQYRPAAGAGYSVAAEDRLDDDSEYYAHGGGHNAYGPPPAHDEEADLPPYPSTPYGAHAQPYGNEPPYSDRR